MNIKHFLKVFAISFLASLLLMVVGVYGFIKAFDPVNAAIEQGNENFGIDGDGNGENTAEENITFEEAVKNSNRINVLVVGLEGSRTDTIMVASYDRDDKIGNVISVPRDTYYYREGYSGGYLKINAVYGDEEVGGLIKAVQDTLGIPIHKYVFVDYKAVVVGIDALGGIDVEIPQGGMVYSDPSQNLYINIPEGVQHLDGTNGLKALRFRSGYNNGDIGRIEFQQKFITEVVKKLISFQLPKFINEVYPYIDTNFSLSELISLAGDAPGFSMSNLYTDVMPFNPKWIEELSFVEADKIKVLELVYRMYGITE